MRKAKSFMVKNTDFKVKMHGFDYQLYSFLVWLWEAIYACHATVLLPIKWGKYQYKCCGERDKILQRSTS